MVSIDYINAVRNVLSFLESTQLESVENAASLIVESLKGGGVVFCSGIGHGNEGDFINRAGGLAAVRPFSYSFSVNSPLSEHHAQREAEPDLDLETVRLALRSAKVKEGDVMMMGSVSGRNRAPVELALACKDMGVKTIGFTSFTYTDNIVSLHPSGTRLRDAVDVAIDIGAPFGDAAVTIPGYDHDLMPVSGVAFTVSGWMVWGAVLERMADLGDTPTVFMSFNRPGGEEKYHAAVKRWNERGY